MFSNDELRRLFEALKWAPKQIAALWLMLFYTGNRLRETLKMEWTWIDREKKHLILPAAITKNKRQHLVPLVPQALKLLDMLKELAGDSRCVFPGPTGDAMNWVQKACDRLMARAGIEDGRHHDTRRVLATRAGIAEGLILAPEHEDKRTQVPADRSLMGVTQAANTLGISRAAVHKAIQHKRLAAQRYGNVLLVSRDAVLRYKQERAEGGRKSSSSRAQAAGEASSGTVLVTKGR